MTSCTDLSNAQGQLSTANNFINTIGSVAWIWQNSILGLCDGNYRMNGRIPYPTSKAMDTFLDRGILNQPQAAGGDAYEMLNLDNAQQPPTVTVPPIGMLFHINYRGPYVRRGYQISTGVIVMLLLASGVVTVVASGMGHDAFHRKKDDYEANCNKRNIDCEFSVVSGKYTNTNCRNYTYDKLYYYNTISITLTWLASAAWIWGDDIAYVLTKLGISTTVTNVILNIMITGCVIAVADCNGHANDISYAMNYCTYTSPNLHSFHELTNICGLDMELNGYLARVGVAGSTLNVVFNTFWLWESYIYMPTITQQCALDSLHQPPHDSEEWCSIVKGAPTHIATSIFGIIALSFPTVYTDALGTIAHHCDVQIMEQTIC